MRKPLDSMRIIHWASGADMPRNLPISDPQPDPGLLGPDSLTWLLHEEQWLILSGARAFLMQAAHPIVAQGALDHSAFAEDPFGRVYRTIQGMAVLIFGSTAGERDGAPYQSPASYRSGYAPGKHRALQSRRALQRHGAFSAFVGAYRLRR